MKKQSILIPMNLRYSTVTEGRKLSDAVLSCGDRELTQSLPMRQARGLSSGKLFRSEEEQDGAGCARPLETVALRQHGWGLLLGNHSLRGRDCGRWGRVIEKALPGPAG